MSDWKIASRDRVCHGCAATFEDGQVLFSALSSGTDGIGRSDFCATCWAKPERADVTGDDPIWWRTRHREGRRGLQLDLESIEGLFLALEGRDDESLAELRYLLGLILMRKRRLKVVRAVRRSDFEGFVVRRPRRTEEFVLRVFDLDAERAAQLKLELQRIFEGADLEEVVAAAAASPQRADEVDAEAAGEGGAGDESEEPRNQADERAHADAADGTATDGTDGEERAPGGRRSRSSTR